MGIVDPGKFEPEPILTGPEVAEKAGIGYETVTRLNRALGFPELDSSTVAYSDRDVDVLRILQALVEGGFPLDRILEVARVYGRSFAQISDIETRLFRDYIVKPLREEGLATSEIEEKLTDVVESELQMLAKVMDYIHRRHLANSIQQLSGTEDADTERLSVGFVDLVDFSSITDDLHGADLGELVDAFEQVAIQTCADHEVRVVKMIGDAVMFVAAQERRTLAAARAIVQHVCSDENLPQARAGLDVGDVVAFGADYFGRPVNIAARITAYALPDTTVISQAMLDAFPEGELDVAKIGSRTLKGVGRVRMYKVREGEP